MKKVTYLRLFLLILVLLLMSNCGLFRSDEEETAVPPVATILPTAIDTPSATFPSGGGTPVDALPGEGLITLVLWASDDYAPTSETEGGMKLLDQIQAFQQSRGVRVEVILKKRAGTGGLLDFLTTASAAAPSILPDLITLSDGDLYQAAQAGLLQPLDDLVSPAVFDDQFDFALELTKINGATMGVLYQADLQHLVYSITDVEEPPLSWRDLYSSTVPFVFSPVASADGVSDVILIQYLALGGQLTNQAGEPALNAEQLTLALEFFQKAQRSAVVPRSVLDLSDATTAWATYRIGEAGMVQVPASLYLAERAGLSNTGFSQVPLSVPGVTTVGRGWALAVVTQDPRRQPLAAALIEFLLSPENNGAWTRAAGRLPTRNAAFDAWDQDDAYLPFARNLLAHAEPVPNPNLAVEVGGPLVQALVDVLSGTATPEEAAQTAVEAVEAGR